MELNVGAEEVLDRAEHDQVRKCNSTMATPEEGWRLVREFIRVRRADLREEILDFAERVLRRQEGR
jgi:hypothetical protein